MDDVREIILKALAVTAELTGTELSKTAARVFAEDLSSYPVDQVLGALTRCRREVKGKLSVADVVSRLEDGRPGAEEAWAMIPRSEQESVVWTEEMSQAFGVCYRMIEAGDEIAARMAFKEAYTAAVNRARNSAVPVKWIPSLGRDESLRAPALEAAVAKGRMLPERAQALLPHLEISSVMLGHLPRLT